MEVNDPITTIYQQELARLKMDFPRCVVADCLDSDESLEVNERNGRLLEVPSKQPHAWLGAYSKCLHDSIE
jgi:hypothetical protein